jgi:hypothetical protein
VVGLKEFGFELELPLKDLLSQAHLIAVGRDSWLQVMFRQQSHIQRPNVWESDWWEENGVITLALRSQKEVNRVTAFASLTVELN